MFKDFILPVLGILFVVWCVLGFVQGIFNTFPPEHILKEKECRYKNVAAYANPGYILSCELFKERFAKETEHSFKSIKCNEGRVSVDFDPSKEENEL